MVSRVVNHDSDPIRKDALKNRKHKLPLYQIIPGYCSAGNVSPRRPRPVLDVEVCDAIQTKGGGIVDC